MEAEKDYIRDFTDKSKKSKHDPFESWIVDLEEKEQPETCSIDDDDCEACGS